MSVCAIILLCFVCHQGRRRWALIQTSFEIHFSYIVWPLSLSLLRLIHRLSISFFTAIIFIIFRYLNFDGHFCFASLPHCHQHHHQKITNKFSFIYLFLGSVTHQSIWERQKSALIFKQNKRKMANIFQQSVSFLYVFCLHLSSFFSDSHFTILLYHFTTTAKNIVELFRPFTTMTQNGLQFFMTWFFCFHFMFPSSQQTRFIDFQYQFCRFL